jgi:EpsI family protein
MSFLNNRYAKILTLVLLLQAAAFYAVAMRSETIPEMQPLAVFPTVLADGWTMAQDAPLEKAVLDVLKADDTLNRQYVNPVKKGVAYFFMAFFKTQRDGQAPHSPKNCLPGAGWTPLQDTTMAIQVEGWPEPIVTNKFVTQRGNEKSLSLYWYQSHNRVIASEYSAKFWLVADAIRYRRSDTALVRVVIPVKENDLQGATDTGIQFVQASFPAVIRHLPQ